MNTIPDYTPSSTSKRTQLIVTVTGALGIPAIILPFAFSYSPLAAAWSDDMFLNDLWRLSWPFFLPLFITIANIRWMILGKHTQPEIIAGYFLGAAILCVTFSGYVTSFEWEDDTRSQIAFITPFIILLFGIFFLLRNRKKLLPKPGGAIVAMQIAYLVNCSLCLISFMDNWQIAAYLSLITAITYVIQIFLLTGVGTPHKSMQA